MGFDSGSTAAMLKVIRTGSALNGATNRFECRVTRTAVSSLVDTGVTPSDETVMLGNRVVSAPANFADSEDAYNVRLSGALSARRVPRTRLRVVSKVLHRKFV